MDNIEYFEATARDVEAIGRFNGISESELYVHEYWTRLPGHSVLMAAKKDEKVIGLQAFIAYYVCVNGHKILTGKSERSLVSPEYRGRHVWANLMEGCVERGEERGHRFFWGASTPAVKAFKKLGFLHIHGHRQRLLSAVNMARVIKLLGSSKSTVSINPLIGLRAMRQGDLEQGLNYLRIIASIYSSFHKMIHPYGFSVNTNSAFDIVKLPKRYKDIYRLYQEIRGYKSNLIWLHQDEGFCDWAFRLGHNPVKRWFAYDKGKLRAYLYTIFDDSLAKILDFAAADKAAFTSLLDCFQKECIENGQIFSEVTVNPLCPAQRIPIKCFTDRGFLKAYTGGTTVVRTGKYKDLNILGDPASYYMTDLWSLLYNRKAGGHYSL